MRREIRRKSRLGNFFRIDKGIVHLDKLAEWNDREVALYPVLMAHTDAKGECYPNIETMAKLSGLSKRWAGKAVKELAERPEIGLTIKREHQGGGRWKHSYKVVPLPRNHQSTVRFYLELVNGGHWSALSRQAQRVYLAMRGMALRVDETEYETWLKALDAR